MSRRTGAAGRWTSWLTIKWALTSIFVVIGVVAGLVMAPSALAEPDPNLPAPPPEPVEVAPPRRRIRSLPRLRRPPTRWRPPLRPPTRQLRHRPAG